MDLVGEKSIEMERIFLRESNPVRAFPGNGRGAAVDVVAGLGNRIDVADNLPARQQHALELEPGKAPRMLGDLARGLDRVPR